MSESNKQLVSFVLDNSASLPREKLAALMNGFRRLAAQTSPAALEWELLTFDGFAPTVVKSFADTEIAPVRAGRMPLLTRAIEHAAQRLTERAEELNCTHLPWLVLLCNGFAFDDPASLVIKLEEDKKVVYLPFKLSPTLHTARMQAVDRVKHMITIKEEGIDGFFAFFEGLLARRAEAGAEGGLKFRKNDFEGWGEL